MAAVQTLHNMTLGRDNHHHHHQANKMFIHHSPNQQNCVIVSTGLPQQPIGNKSVIQTKRPLAPAPEKTVLVQNNNNNNNNTDILKCKRKINFVPYGNGGGGHQPASVARRNARERNRVKQVNNGFATLRQHIPASVAAALAAPSPAAPTPSAASGGRGASKKLSKVETLRMAVEYIRSLQKMLEEYEMDTTSTTSTATTTTNNYYPNQDHQMIHQLNNSGHQILTQQTPPCSEASSSPTPSFSSESSVSAASSYATTAALYYAENYENYRPTSPEDEELLDAISWWQEQ